MSLTLIKRCDHFVTVKRLNYTSYSKSLKVLIMKLAIATTNHAQSIPVGRNYEYQFQNLFTLKISLFLKAFIIEQRKIQQHRMV